MGSSRSVLTTQEGLCQPSLFDALDESNQTCIGYLVHTCLLNSSRLSSRIEIHLFHVSLSSPSVLSLRQNKNKNLQQFFFSKYVFFHPVIQASTDLQVFLCSSLQSAPSSYSVNRDLTVIRTVVYLLDVNKPLCVQVQGKENFARWSVESRYEQSLLFSFDVTVVSVFEGWEQDEGQVGGRCSLTSVREVELSLEFGSSSWEDVVFSAVLLKLLP